MKYLFIFSTLFFFLSCSKEVEQSNLDNLQPKLQVCDIPLLPPDSIVDTTGILSSTPYDIEKPILSDYNDPIGLIFLEYRSTRIVSPYWNGGVPFRTKQVVFDSTTIKYLPLFANVKYGSWRVRFTIDSVYFTNFTGMKDTLHVVSNMIQSDNSSVETNLLSFASGVAFINGLYIPQVNHGFVFANVFPDTRYKKLDMASIVVHEAGHMLGLYHQSEYDVNCSKINEYRPGTFMGNPFYPTKGKWFIGPSSRGCGVIQDDTLKLNENLGKIF